MYKFKLVAIAGHSTASSKVNFLHFGGHRPVVRRHLLPSGTRRRRQQGSASAKGGAPAASAGSASAASNGPGAAGPSASSPLQWTPVATAAEFAALEAEREQRRQELRPHCKVCRAACAPDRLPSLCAGPLRALTSGVQAGDSHRD